MRKHILSKYSKTKKFYGKPIGFYDELSQVTYLNKSLNKKLMDRGKATSLTETIENSNQDEFICKEWTRSTNVVENSDSDEFSCYESTKQTFEIEITDPDEFLY